MSQKTGYFIRDTFVKYSDLKMLPIDKQIRIKELTELYNNSGYIDARFNIGPDQARRMTDRQRESITSTALTVFEIESEIKLLLKTDNELQEIKSAKEQENMKSRLLQVNSYIQLLERSCANKLKSSRMNKYKKAYHAAIAEREIILRTQPK